MVMGVIGTLIIIIIMMTSFQQIVRCMVIPWEPEDLPPMKHAVVNIIIMICDIFFCLLWSNVYFQYAVEDTVIFLL